MKIKSKNGKKESCPK